MHLGSYQAIYFSNKFKCSKFIIMSRNKAQIGASKKKITGSQGSISISMLDISYTMLERELLWLRHFDDNSRWAICLKNVKQVYKLHDYIIHMNSVQLQRLSDFFLVAWVNSCKAFKMINCSMVLLHFLFERVK